MESFTLAVRVITPLLVYMVVGVLVRRFSIMNEESLKSLNSMIFRILIPLMLFCSIYKADIRSAVRPKLYIYVLGCIIVLFYVSWAILKRRMKDDLPAAATLAQAIARSNFALFGVSVGASLCDSDGMGTIATLMTVVTPAYGVLSVVLFSALQSKAMSKGHIIIDVFRNPIVLAGILGFIVSLAGIRLPEVIVKAFDTLGGTATPMALIALGGMLTIKSLSNHRKYIIGASVMRLILVPLVTLLVGWLLGMRGVELIAVLSVFAAPTAVASTPMAQEMGGDAELAGEIVAVTSFFSIITIFLWILVMSKLGLL